MYGVGLGGVSSTCVGYGIRTSKLYVCMYLCTIMPWQCSLSHKNSRPSDIIIRSKHNGIISFYFIFTSSPFRTIHSSKNSIFHFSALQENAVAENTFYDTTILYCTLKLLSIFFTHWTYFWQRFYIKRFLFHMLSLSRIVTFY